MPIGIPRLKLADGVDEITARLEGGGAVIVEDLLSADVLARLNRELDPHLAHPPSAPSERRFINDAVAWFFGPQTDHVTGVAGKSRTFAIDVMCHPLLLEVCDRILLRSCARYQLNLGHVLDRGPGADAQLLHRDELVWSDVPRPHDTLQIASMIALCDFSEENGATRIVPGSHRWPADRVPDESETVAAVMPAGAAVLYLGSTIHGGGANRSTDQRRRGLHLSYVVGWLRTEENSYLAVPLDRVRDLPRRCLELLGYSAHDALRRGGGYLGAVDVRDPLEMIERGEL
jgi:ectoine hydroxylase-related dioxygenase (phytanoyl-CoA dioxygenase family)